MSGNRVRIGCAGAGLLGGAIMRRLVDQGFDVRVWNRTAAKLAPVVEAGATPVDSPADLARDSDYVLTCLTDGAAVESVVFGDDGVASVAAPGLLLIDMSTIAAELTVELAARLRESCGAGWLDAPISGGAPAALEGRMAVMVGGEQSDFERAKPIFQALAGRCTLMGGSGAGQSTKMINQVLVACGFAVLAEACGLAERAGVNPARIPEALAGGRADSALLQEFLPKMAASDFAPQGVMSLMTKDLEMIHDLANACGASMPMTGLVTQLNRKCLLDGLGDRDNTELVRFFRPGGGF